MPNRLDVSVEDPDKLRNIGAYDTGALMRIQSSATEAGAYADISGTGATPLITIVADTRSYTGFDPAGTASTWYRVRYENAAGTRTSDWTDPFQVGGEEGGQLAGLDDIRQRLGLAETDTEPDEDLLEFSRQVTTAIEGYCSRWFVPRPLSGTTTKWFHTTSGRTLRIPKGIRSITSLKIATWDQPYGGGGTYTTATATDYGIDPLDTDRDVGWPGTQITFLRNITGNAAYFYDALNGAEIVGSFGFAEPPADIQGVALNVIVRSYQAKRTGVLAAIGSPEFGGRILRWISPEEREMLEWYRSVPIA